MAPRILILGTPRSGTTWVFDVLASTRGASAVLEPDNEKVSLLARLYKGHLPRFPTLLPGEPDTPFRKLWLQAMQHPLAPWLGTNRVLRSLEGTVFQGEKLVARKEAAALARYESQQRAVELANVPVPSASISPRHDGTRPRLVKSVHAIFAAEWITSELAWDQVLLVQRMPHGILASMKKLSMADALRPGSLAPHWTSDHQRSLAASARDQPEHYFAAAAQQLAIMYAWMEQLKRRHPQWQAITHETLCSDPVGQYRLLFDRLGLEFDSKIEASIRGRDRPGEGFATVRKASDQIGKWKKSLTAGEIGLIDDLFARQGLEMWCSQQDAP
jgi:hypothetical protein